KEVAALVEAEKAKAETKTQAPKAEVKAEKASVETSQAVFTTPTAKTTEATSIEPKASVVVEHTVEEEPVSETKPANGKFVFLSAYVMKNLTPA
ncbi:hypothetical protein IR145_03100, partial [Streptococcus danieliae]|nr:hypothetical protein [Streptococcus danieliae]